MRTGVLVRYVGIALIMIALMMGVSAAVAIADGFDESTMPLILSSVITFIAGLFPMIFVHVDPKIKTNEGIAIVVLSWLACCIFGMLPYICYGGEFTVMDAFFESVSGFTTTGASILEDIEGLPTGLLFWRVSTAWVGGLGIVTFFSLVIPHSMDTRSVLSSAELSDLTRSQSSKHGKSFVKAIMLVYVVLTVACAVFLRIAGIGWFDAVTNAMSTCSTCGFCVRNASIGAYDSLAVELIIILFMTLSGVSFVALSSLAIRKKGGHVMTSTSKAYLVFLVVATVLITVNIQASGHGSFGESLRMAAFQVSSISTTTGFATADTTLWPAHSIIILVVASIICGCSGSTSGGIKMDRVVMLFKYIRNGFRTVINPHRVMGTKMDGRIVSERTATEAMKFVLVYMALIVVGGLVNTLCGLDIETGVSAAVACIGNVGPGFGSAGSFGNYADFPAFLKFTSALLMIAGRLEIFPLLSFIGLSASRHCFGE